MTTENNALGLYVWKATNDQFDVVTNMAVAYSSEQAIQLILEKSPEASPYLCNICIRYPLEGPMVLTML